MPPVDNADEKIARRSAVESEHNALRAAREKQYVSDKQTLEEEFQADIRSLRQAKEAALVGVDLNPDGSDPQGRQQGSAE